MPRPGRWLFAVLAGVVAVAVRAAIQPLVGDALPFVLAFPACVLVALRCGAVPATLTAAVCGVGLVLPFIPPNVAARDLPLQLGAFLVSAVVTALICAQFHATRADAAQPAAAGTDPAVDTPLTRWLQAVVWGAALIPLTVFVAAAWWGYQNAFENAEKAVTRVNQVMAQHAERTFQAAASMAAKAADLSDVPDAELRAREALVHERLSYIVDGVPSMLALTVWDRDGHPLVSSGPFPVPVDTTVADRPWFQSLKQGGPPVGVTGLVKGRLQQQPLFNLVTRRATAGGEFAGAIAVSLLPRHFDEFYHSLATEEAGLNTFALYTDDGTVLTRWPPPPQALTRLPDDSPLIVPARAGSKGDVLFVRSTIDDQLRLVSYQRLSQLPLYVSTSLSEQAILGNWNRFVALLAAVLAPITLGLVYVSYVALKKTRQEQSALLALQEEMRLRAQAEKTALQSQKLEALAQLTGGVAHDFNNLLAIVNGNLHLLKRQHPEVREGKHVAAISRAAASGVRLTRQLLSFSRKQALNPDVIRLQDWLPGVSGLLKTTLGSGVVLVIEVAPDTATVKVDTAEFELALINLAVNAKDAMARGGSLRIEVGNEPHTVSAMVVPQKPGRVVVRVTDTGTGIPPEVMGKVFEPFFTTKPQNKGTGLGLSQVYGFCVQAGGVATVQSEPGRGTTVSMLLPAADTAPAAPLAADADLLPSMQGRVLLVEDNEAVSDAYAAVLRSAGLDVYSASSADAALAMAMDEQAAYEVVVSDVAMPGSIDGIQFALKLRELRPRLSVILMTGYAARMEEALAAGLRVLSKPVDANVLFAEVDKVLAEQRPA